MVPLGTNNAASRPKISAARLSSRLMVGSSAYTSSPTSASNMARRMAGEGLVTVSLRRSMTGSALEVCVVSGELYIEILQYEFSDEFSRTIQAKQTQNPQSAGVSDYIRTEGSS